MGGPCLHANGSVASWATNCLLVVVIFWSQGGLRAGDEAAAASGAVRGRVCEDRGPARAAQRAQHGAHAVLCNSGGIVLSDIQQIVLTNREQFYLRVPSWKALCACPSLRLQWPAAPPLEVTRCICVCD